MQAFLAIIITMDLVNQKNIQDYRSADEVLSTLFFPQIMSRDKFKNILAFFHSCDNGKYRQEGYNPVNKLGTIYSVILGSFRTFGSQAKIFALMREWFPSEEKCTSKCTIQTSLLSIVLSYQLCDSSNEYCCMFEIYIGANLDPPRAKGKIYHLVMRLWMWVGVCMLTTATHHLLYLLTSIGRTLGHVVCWQLPDIPTLFAELHRQNTGVCGTAPYRKGIP